MPRTLVCRSLWPQVISSRGCTPRSARAGSHGGFNPPRCLPSGCTVLHSHRQRVKRLVFCTLHNHEADLKGLLREQQKPPERVRIPGRYVFSVSGSKGPLIFGDMCPLRDVIDGLLTGQVWAGRVLKSFRLQCPIPYMAQLAEMLSPSCPDPTFLYPIIPEANPSRAPAGGAVSPSRHPSGAPRHGPPRGPRARLVSGAVSLQRARSAQNRWAGARSACA